MSSVAPPLVVEPAEVAIPRVVRRNTILLAAAQALVGVGNQMVPALGAIMVLGFTGSAALAGLGTGLLSISRFAVAYPVGWITDTFGRRVGLFLGLVVGLIGAPVIAGSLLVGSFPLFIVGLLIFGLGVGAAQQLRLAAADMYPPHRRAEGLGYVLTGSLIGAFGGPALISVAERLAPGFGLDPIPMAWLLVPVVILPTMVLVLLIRPDPREIARNLERYYGVVFPSPAASVTEVGGRSGVRTWVAHYPLRAAFASSFAVQGVMTMMMAMTSLALAHHGHELPFISLAVSIHVVGMYGLSLPLGRLADRVGRRNMMLAGLAITGLGAGLVPTSPAYWVITSGTFLVGVGWSCVNVSSSALIADTTEVIERGRAIGTNDSFSGAAAIVMPILGGPLVELAGLPILAVVSAVLLVPPALLLLRLGEPSPGRYTHASLPA